MAQMVPNEANGPEVAQVPPIVTWSSVKPVSACAGKQDASAISVLPASMSAFDLNDFTGLLL